MAMILIADDDDAIRRLMVRLLTRQGHDVIEARHGGDALAVVVSGLDLDLLVTDIDIPVLDGLGLVREVATVRPTLPVLVCSGSREHVPDVPVLPKPFTPDELRAAVDGVLAHHRPRACGVDELREKVRDEGDDAARDDVSRCSQRHDEREGSGAFSQREKEG